MKVVFSFNQVSQLQLNAARFRECYDLVRSYLGYEVGTLFSAQDFLTTLEGDEFVRYSDDSGNLCFSIRGNEFDHKMIVHACQVELAWIQVQKLFFLGAAADQLYDPSGFAKRLSKAVKSFKKLLDDTEW